MSTHDLPVKQASRQRGRTHSDAGSSSGLHRVSIGESVCSGVTSHNKLAYNPACYPFVPLLKVGLPTLPTKQSLEWANWPVSRL